MSKISIIDTPQATLWYHPEEKIVHHHIRKYIYGEEFHHILLAGTDLIKKFNAQKWLSNTQSDVLLRQEDLEWARQIWFPQTRAAGWNHWAVVQPNAVFVQMDLNPIVIFYSQAGINVKYFIVEDEAFRWLADL